MNRKDFRPANNYGTGMSDKDRATIRSNKKVGDRDHVIRQFLDGKEAKTSNNSLHTDGNKLYSYNTVIGMRQKDGSVVVNNTKYSQTTTVQQNRLTSALKERHEKYEVTGGKQRGYEGEDFSESHEQHERNESKSQKFYDDNGKLSFIKTSDGRLYKQTSDGEKLMQKNEYVVTNDGRIMKQGNDSETTVARTKNN